jgi:hypothetical protein
MKAAILTLVVVAGVCASVAGEVFNRVVQKEDITNVPIPFTIRGNYLGPDDLLLRVEGPERRALLYVANALDDAGRREITVVDDSAFVIRSSDGGVWRRCGR